MRVGWTDGVAIPADSTADGVTGRLLGGEGAGMVPGSRTSARAGRKNLKRGGGRPVVRRGGTGGRVLGWVWALMLGMGVAVVPVVPAASFEGAFFRGDGAVEDLRLLDNARRMLGPDPEFQNLSMLYTPQWNGLVEGPTWGAWWVQNSYGTTYAALPFFEEPLVTFLQNSQDLWFDRMGDGKTSYVWNGKDSWVPPDGCLMDAASDTWAIHRQGDGRVGIHDWGMEFTAAGGLLQSELLLISRDRVAMARYLPKLERCADFVESRRDPDNDLFRVGPAGNLLAPSYAGYRRPDGTYGMAYLTGLSVTTIAFLDRLIELEKLAGRMGRAEELGVRRARARAALARVTTEDGYLIKSLDPDGTRHGVYGAAKHGYFEASPNHDAMCFRVVDDAQARRIYGVMAAIPGLRPHGLIVANCPSLDDMYEEPRGLWGFGTWVNGGHWTTCEARMMVAYHRVGAFGDARRAMEQILRFARQFRMDNPLVEFGGAVYQPREPINITYDAFGAPAGFLRGLFEYLYRADGLTLIPHMPEGIDRLEQKFPVRFGTKRLHLALSGHGPIESVRINGRRWRDFDATSVHLPYDRIPEVAAVEIVAGGGSHRRWRAPREADAGFRWRAMDAGNAGLLLAETAGDGVLAANELPFRIGADGDGGSRLVGEIAQVAVFRRALTTGEIAVLAGPGSASLWQDPAMVGRWRLSQPVDGLLPNLVGAAPSARVVGRVAFGESPHGPAVRLDGGGYLEVTNHPALALTGGGTWALWLRPGETKGRLMDKCPVGGETGYTFDTHPGNVLRLISDAGVLGADARLVPGEWVHVAATVDAGSGLALYVNGRRVAGKAGKVRSGLDVAALVRRVERVDRFVEALQRAGLSDTYEAAHARWVVGSLAVARQRAADLAEGRWARLPARSQAAADRLYLDTTARLLEGLTRRLEKEKREADPRCERMRTLWASMVGAER